MKTIRYGRLLLLLPMTGLLLLFLYFSHDPGNIAKAEPDRPDYTSVYVYSRTAPTLHIKPCLAENTNEQELYLFLPFSEQEYLWSVPSGINLYVGEKPVKSGDPVVSTDPQKEYLFAIEKDGEFTDAHYLRCMASDGVAAFSVTMQDEALSAIVNEHHPLTAFGADMRVFTGAGETIYTPCYIGGHGGSTWMLIKKSFEIETETALSILGLKESTRWNLIANGMDRSQVKNRIVYEAAHDVGMEYSIGSEYVNLYLNGVYQGLYLLTEKPAANGGAVDFDDDLERETRKYARSAVLDPVLDAHGTNEEERYYDIPHSPPDITGSYLMEFDYYQKNLAEESADSWFMTNEEYGYYMVVLKQPRHATRDELHYIKSYVRGTEDAIYSEDGVDNKTGVSIRDRIDFDSWAMSYLFMDFFGYQDDSAGSLFFYKKRGDPLLYSGPVWDYDKSMTDNYYGDELAWYGRGDLYLWYDRLNSYEDFHAKVVSNYIERLSPSMELILSDKLPGWIEDISSSLAMDDVKWNRGESYGENHVRDVEEWLAKRKELFDSVWVRGEDSPYAENIY